MPIRDWNKRLVKKTAYPLASLLSAYKGLKRDNWDKLFKFLNSLLSAYKGLKLVEYSYVRGQSDGLLSAYKGLKLTGIRKNILTGYWFIKCL